MKIERQNIIDQEINKQGFVLVPAMSEMLKCSEETIRRDLKEMESQGRLMRTHGGAYLIENFDKTYPTNLRKAYYHQTKDCLARRAIEHMQENDIVMLDSSTTCLALAEAMIRSQKMLTVITNSLQICLLCNESNISFLVKGGKSAVLIPLFQWCVLNDMQQLQFHCIRLQLSQLASIVQHLFDGFCRQSVDEMHTGANPTGF